MRLMIVEYPPSRIDQIIVSFFMDIVKEKAEMESDKRAPDSLTALNKSVLPVLCRRFYNKGLMPIETKRVTRDISNIIDNGGWRSGIIRRQFNYTMHIPERRFDKVEQRSGKDRRSGAELIES